VPKHDLAVAGMMFGKRMPSGLRKSRCSFARRGLQPDEPWKGSILPPDKTDKRLFRRFWRFLGEGFRGQPVLGAGALAPTEK
jgi:hypothetical protein